MKLKFTAAALLLSLVIPASAHRLDEYLQATLISVAKNHIQVSMRLIPGVAVSSAVIASIDSNADGVISASEQQAYAQRVLNDLSLTADGNRLTPKLVSIAFPEIEQMKQGLGEIQIEFVAALPPGGSDRKFTLENHHQNQISVYLVNCLVPHDHDIQIVAQNRNPQQSFYELNYTQSAAAASVQGSSSFRGWIGNWMSSAMSSAGFTSIFRLGMRHIAEGTDIFCSCSCCFCLRLYSWSVRAGLDSLTSAAACCESCESSPHLPSGIRSLSH